MQDISLYQANIRTWYALHKRDLPWRHTHDPYCILISEVMLQQTQAPRVVPKYEDFLRLFPTVEALAAATNGEVLRAWSGLGYNSRALRLKAIAERVVKEFGGQFPRTREALQGLKGIGEYTSGAILAFAFGEQVSFYDTNIKRIVHRVCLGLEFQGWKNSEKELKLLVEQFADKEHTYEYHQALMDLGSSHCQAKKINCAACPLEEICVASKEIKMQPQLLMEKRVSYKKDTVPFKQSKRYIRGGIVEYLRIHDAGVSFKEIYEMAISSLRPMDQRECREILQDLLRDGLIRQAGMKYHL